ncbi:MLP-like protein 34 [Benincasa hispida]|uniref:MLP-like protein 34 n=1 Tax=Benincasa hispida TaxID=102211 RepID=UPI0019002BE3|nr:MLP-like protein 34 [Benincasa hispida]
MSQNDSIWVKVQLKSSIEKFYGFFRNHMGDLVNMFPEQFKNFQYVEGENFSADTIVQLKYHLGSHQLLTAKIKLRVVDDVKKCIIYEAVEGDVLKHYKVFIVKLEAVNGGLSNKVGGSFAKWTVDFVKANEYVPSPENYLEMFVNISKGVDAYFSKN